MSIIVDHIVYLSDSDPDYNPESTEFAPRRPKRRRLEPAIEPGSSFSCSGCNETLNADSKVYFLPFCGCLYCRCCVVQPVLDELLHLRSALGRAAVDLVRTSANHNGMKLPTSSINLLMCKNRGHPQIPGAIECYGTACPICTLEGSLSDERVYLSCGHPFCQPHITKWIDEKRRACPTCRSVISQEDAHFNKDGTYTLGWPRSFS